MDEDAKYPEKVQAGMNVKYALNEDDPEEKWEESTVESVQDQPSFVPKGTFCRFVNFRLGYVKKILKLRELSKKMISDLINSTEGKEIEGGFSLSVGNPHIIFFVEDFNKFNLREIGPKIENHNYFPENSGALFST